MSISSALSPSASGRHTSLKKRKETTLKRSVSSQGIGLFTGAPAAIALSSAPAGAGVVFKRTDLPGQPLLSAKLANIHGTPRCTIIGNQEISVQTVEHLLSALSACGIDNVLIELSGPEVPIFDGSAAPFVKMIEEAGVIELEEGGKNVYSISSPVHWSKGDVHLIALPSEEYRISYTLHYPQSRMLGTQFYTVAVNKENFVSQIAFSRTFSLYEEVAPMIEKGLIKGGSLENGVIIKEDAVLNPEGLRCADEMVRHKLLDLIGDLSLVEDPFIAHIIAIRSGHASNSAFARELQNHIKMESS